uniref:Junctophilin n=1 Tax=Echinococcus granulosus TaxID=6210 RepID=A0A068WKV8_ECHGR|nr:junctophilin [Echinococcus granulosus]
MSNPAFGVPQIVQPPATSVSTITATTTATPTGGTQNATTNNTTTGRKTNAKEPGSPLKPVCLPAGRYEFRDNGIYIGEWLDEKAVGLGLITKDKSQGEYTGLWEAGSEKSGVFLWPNAPGAMYEGEWAMNRRNGFGVFNREDWVIMGKFEDDFITMGVKGKDNAPGKFEGRFENGFPAFGVETYGDKGTYCGDYKNGIREGLGVRRSITYGEVLELYPEIKKASNSSKLEDLRKRGKLPSPLKINLDRRMSFDQGSIDVPCEAVWSSENNSDGVDGVMDGEECDPEPYTAPRDTTSYLECAMGHRHQNATYRLMVAQRCGFMLSSKRSELFIKRLNKLKHPRINPFGCTTPEAPERKRTQSLSMLFTYPEETMPTLPKSYVRQIKDLYNSSNSLPKIIPAENDTLELDLIADDTVEVYSGEWFSDARHGYGVCERTDGLAYYGQWFKNQRHGFGHTRFPDGTFEQGKYHNGKLVYLALPAGNKPHMVLYNRHVMQEVQKMVHRAMLAGEQAQKKAIEAREQVSMKVLDYIEKAKAAASCAREYSLEARELVREMYPDFEQPGIKYLEDIVRMMRVTRQGSPTFEAALQSAKDVVAGIVRGLTRGGGEEDEEEEATNQPEEDLTLPPKFSSQLRELQEKKLLMSRAGSVRAQRRARALKLAEELRRRERLLMGEDPKSVMAATTAEAQRQQQQAQQQTDEAKKRAATATATSQLSTSGAERRATAERSIGTERADRWTTEMLPMSGRRQQSAPLNASGKADTAPGAFLHVPGVKRNYTTRRRKEDAGMEETDGSYVEIPDMNELEHQYEIPACPLTKLLANPTLFSNHFDYYTTLPPPIAVKATATTGLHQARLTRPEVLVQPEKTMSAAMEYTPSAKEVVSPTDSEGFGFLSNLAFWSWGKNEEASKDREVVSPVPSANGFPSASASVTSFSQMVAGSQEGGTDAVQLMSRGLADSPQNHLIPTTDSSHSLQQFSDIFDWFRSNLSLIAIICFNFFLLHVFFAHMSQSEENGA